jgi:hypothetical protein
MPTEDSQDPNHTRKTRIILALPADAAERLKEAVKDGSLAKLGISSVTFLAQDHRIQGPWTESESRKPGSDSFPPRK